MKILLATPALIIMTFFSFLRSDAADAVRYVELKNESYGSNPFQKADVYLPANRNAADTRVLLLLHGGAWNSGDKTAITDFVKLVQQHNPALAIVNANYRLVSPSVHLDAQLDDVKQMLNFIVAQGNRWNVSTENIALGGISAGAHLAMLYAYKQNVAHKINAVVSIVGPAYFGDAYYTNNALFQPLITNLLGTPVTDTTSYLQASPAYVVTTKAPATYMAYGGYDPLVPVSNAIYLDKKLTELNVPHQYRFFPNEGHRFNPSTYDVVAKEVVAFLKKYPAANNSFSPIRNR